MTRILIALVATALAVSAFASPEKQYRPAAYGEIEVIGDDLFPWPKGSEMPFPWKTVGGAYNLKAKTSSLYAGHYFQLSVGYDETRRRYLSVNQYDRSGRLFASGRGYPERNPRFINADMVTHITNRAYESLIRAYEGEVIGNDKPKYPVLAVSFCPACCTL